MTETTYQAIGTIRPEDVAKKLEAIQNHEYPELLAQFTARPRLHEMLVHLQFVSMQPGGLVKFAADMLEHLPGRFGTETMRAAKRPEYTLEEKRRIAEEMAGKDIPGFVLEPGETGKTWRELLDAEPVPEETLAAERREREQWLKSWTAQEIRQICQRAAAEILPRYLEDLCIEPDKGFSRSDDRTESYWKSPYWFMDDPIAAILEMMDRRAEEVSRRVAMTAVTKKVFDALDYALQERVMVRIEGDSRFGKTESIRAWADMRPGLARIVKVPSSNSITGLLCRVAEALGIPFSYWTRAEFLRQRIEYVLKRTRVFLILDEAAYLVPQNYTATTAPERLNWVRMDVVDLGLPVALVHTPQTFLPDADKFVKKTRFAMQQFFGRNYRTVQLPNELERVDLLAVAKIHFPEVGDEQLELLADLAELAENYLQTVEAVAKLARFIARREGHRRITVDDIETAAHEVIPGRPAPALSSPLNGVGQAGTKRSLARAAERVVKPSLKAPARAVQPGGMKSAVGGNTPRFSTRGAAAEVAETDLVQVDT